MTGLLGLALAACASAAGGADTESSAQHQAVAGASLVFDGVTVVDVEHGKLLPSQRVVIAGNRIRAIGPASAVSMPRGVQVVDARGKYLIPGLWDLHTHSSQYTDFFYPLFIAGGVTGIRDAGSDVPLDTLLGWRREILAGTRVGPPRQLLSGQSIGQRSSCQRRKHMKYVQTCVTDTIDARHLVDSLITAGADIIKPYGPPKPIYLAIAAEARRLGVPVGGHVGDPMLSAAEAQRVGIPFKSQGHNPAALTAAEASDLGVSLIDHPNSSGGIDRLCMGESATVEQCRPLAEQFRRNGTWFAPTLITFLSSRLLYGEYTGAIASAFGKRARDFWAGAALTGNWLREAIGARAMADSAFARYKGMRLIQEVDLPVLAASDVAPSKFKEQLPGFSLHTELAIYVAEGMTPLRALQTATLNPAKFLKGTDSLGTVAPGKVADLVLLDANPLADITNTTTIRAVVANGRYYDRAALDKLLAEIQAKAKQEPEPFGGARSTPLLPY